MLPTNIWGRHTYLCFKVWNNTKQRKLGDSEAVDMEKKASRHDRIHN